MQTTVYSTTTCAFCHTLTEWLDKRNITYTYKETDTDDAIMEEFIAVADGLIAVPLTVIKNTDGSLIKISGFDRSKLEQAYKV
jgi:glutaredoxin